jgi:hypothetical protein
LPAPERVNAPAGAAVVVVVVVVGSAVVVVVGATVVVVVVENGIVKGALGELYLVKYSSPGHPPSGITFAATLAL